MKDAAPTLRTVAEKSGYSVATVSFALRNHPRVPAATRAKIHAVAREIGWKPNPLVSALQSLRRSQSRKTYQATIAWFDDSPHGLQLAQDRKFLAAKFRGEELGFSLDHVHLAPREGEPPQDFVNRACKILDARGIEAVILPKLYWAPPAAADWGDRVVVVLERIEAFLSEGGWPPCPYHEVAARVSTNVAIAYDHLLSLGCQRIGLAITEWFDCKNDRLPTSVYLGRSLLHQKRLRFDPLHLAGLDGSAEKGFFKWFDAHRPDGILVSNRNVLDWCRKCGIDVPGAVQIAHLELSPVDEGISGVDPLDDLLGQVAVETAGDFLVRNERGIPEHPRHIGIVGKWMPGGTTREPLMAS